MPGQDYIPQPQPINGKRPDRLSKREIALIGIVSLAIVLVGWFALTRNKSVNNFEECVAAGYPVMESWPEQCRAGDRTFTRSGLELPGQETEEDSKPLTGKDGMIAAAANHCRSQGVSGGQHSVEIIESSMKDKSRYTKSGRFVRLSMSCAEGHAEFRLFLREEPDGSWAILGATQDATPGCSWLDGTGVPKAIATECLGRDGQKRPIQPAS